MSKRKFNNGLSKARWLCAIAFVLGTLSPAFGGSISGTGTLTLSGANTFSGPAVVGGTYTGQLTGTGTSSAPAAPAASAPAYVGSFLSPRPVLTIAQPSTPSPENRGPDAKWGDPINADLFEADGVHAKLDYYAGSGNGGTETSVGITFSIKN